MREERIEKRRGEREDFRLCAAYNVLCCVGRLNTHYFDYADDANNAMASMLVSPSPILITTGRAIKLTKFNAKIRDVMRSEEDWRESSAGVPHKNTTARSTDQVE